MKVRSLLLVGLLVAAPALAQETYYGGSYDDQRAGFAYDDQDREIRSVDEFEAPLSRYGRWVPSRFGRAWAPNVGRDWRPYTVGRWVDGPDGREWDSEEPWGWATYHYGRWGFDERFGWVWVPGTDWAPAWVTWRDGDTYSGWAPLPPRLPYNAIDSWDYQRWYAPSWIYVPRPYLYSGRINSRVLPWRNNRDYWERTRRGGTRYDFERLRQRPAYNRRPGDGRPSPGGGWQGRPGRDRDRPDRPGGFQGRPDRPNGNGGIVPPPTGSQRPDRPGGFQGRPDRPDRPDGFQGRPDRPGGFEGRPGRPGSVPVPPAISTPRPDQPRGNWQGRPGERPNRGLDNNGVRVPVNPQQPARDWRGRGGDGPGGGGPSGRSRPTPPPAVIAPAPSPTPSAVPPVPRADRPARAERPGRADQPGRGEGRREGRGPDQQP